jgi:hypothetical protein
MKGHVVGGACSMQQGHERRVIGSVGKDWRKGLNLTTYHKWSYNQSEMNGWLQISFICFRRCLASIVQMRYKVDFRISENIIIIIIIITNCNWVITRWQ